MAERGSTTRHNLTNLFEGLRRSFWFHPASTTELKRCRTVSTLSLIGREPVTERLGVAHAFSVDLHVAERSSTTRRCLTNLFEVLRHSSSFDPAGTTELKRLRTVGTGRGSVSVRLRVAYAFSVDFQTLGI